MKRPPDFYRDLLLYAGGLGCLVYLAVKAMGG